MSSGGVHVAVCGWFGVEEERAVDHVGQSTLQCPDGFRLGVAVLSPAFEEPPRVGVVVRLGDGDAMDGRVKLPVA
jgi:hypothetical protein